jgi:malate/lactate dehydrogenase
MSNPAEHPAVRIDAGRFAKFVWTAESEDKDGNAEPILFSSGDDVLYKISASVGGTPLLTLSKTPKPITGSKVTVEALGSNSDPTIKPWGYVIIYAADTALLGATKEIKRYDEVLLKDSADGNELKTISRGTAVVKPSQS